MAHWDYTSGTLPWTKSCFVCGEANPHGLRLRSRVEGDRIVLEHMTREADLGWRHIVHGGISMTLLDEVMTWAAILTLRRATVAAEITVRLKRPVLAGQAIRAEGWVGEARSKLVVAEGHLIDQAGLVLASATGKYTPMPASGSSLCEKDFVESPEALTLEFLRATP